MHGLHILNIGVVLNYILTLNLLETIVFVCIFHFDTKRILHLITILLRNKIHKFHSNILFLFLT